MRHLDKRPTVQLLSRTVLIGRNYLTVRKNRISKLHVIMPRAKFSLVKIPALFKKISYWRAIYSRHFPLVKIYGT